MPHLLPRLGQAIAPCLLIAAPVLAQQPIDRFDGSYRLESGEVITGGWFVEGGVGRYLFMDTHGLQKGGLFESTGATTMRSVFPPGTIELTFAPDAKGNPSTVTWREAGELPIRGTRTFPHERQDISFTSGDGTTLSGQLLLPACQGPFPVVVTVHGSGPVDRYGGPYHTFFVQHGIAVLSYDKRGYTTDPSAWHEPDLAVLSADAAAAVRFVAGDPRFDSDRIGIFGSSQAGWVVPDAARQAPDVDFLILRAGAALTEAETSLHEVRQELRQAGLSGLDLDLAVQLRSALYDLAMQGESLSATDSIVAPYLGEAWYKVAFGEGLLSGRWSSRRWAWNQRNLSVTPIPALRQFGGPVLWFLAEHDENVPLVSTRAALEAAFRESPGTAQQVVTIPGALHSFLIPNPDGPPRFAPGFFDRMSGWLAERGLTNVQCRWPQRQH